MVRGSNMATLLKITMVFENKPYKVQWVCGDCQSIVAETLRIQFNYCPVCGEKFSETEEKVSS